LRTGPYRVFFYSADRAEPPHVHVERDRYVAKFWLRPVRLVESGDYRALEIRRLQRILTSNEARLLRAWNETFD
jgi:hypothetical protein